MKIAYRVFSVLSILCAKLSSCTKRKRQKRIETRSVFQSKENSSWFICRRSGYQIIHILKQWIFVCSVQWIRVCAARWASSCVRYIYRELLLRDRWKDVMCVRMPPIVLKPYFLGCSVSRGRRRVTFIGIFRAKRELLVCYKFHIDFVKLIGCIWNLKRSPKIFREG